MVLVPPPSCPAAAAAAAVVVGVVPLTLNFHALEWQNEELDLTTVKC